MTPGAGRRDCRIARIDTYVVNARWCNWVFAHVFTDDGLEGVGEGTCEFQPQAVVAVIEQLARRTVLGQSAFQIEKIWQECFRNEFARGGPIINSAIGAIEMACWDIIGKALDRPVYDLLGGRLYDRLPAYANAWYGGGSTPAEIGQAAKEVKAKGYRGLKFDPFADAGRDPTAKAIADGIAIVAAVRDAIGPHMDILIDAHGRFSPGAAIRIARDFEALDVFWFEEPTDPENVQALHKIARSTKVRIATGERCYTKYHLQALLAANEIGVLQPDLIHVGGILEGKKIAAIADAQYIPVSFHNPFGPVATAAAIQLDACTSNFVMQESFCEWTPALRFDLLDHPPRPNGGHYDIPTLPGLGVGNFRPEAAKAHPFEPDAFLPMWKENWRANF